MKKFAFDQQFMVGVVAGGAAVAVVVSMLWVSKRKQGKDPQPANVSSSSRARGPVTADVHDMILRQSSGMPAHITIGDDTPPATAGATTMQRMVMDEMSQQRYSVTVRVPATTANLGPGFDTIGMALDMWSEFTVEIADEFSLTNEGDGKDDIPTDETNLICAGVNAHMSSPISQCHH